jgi:hypothetical protein
MHSTAPEGWQTRNSYQGHLNFHQKMKEYVLQEIKTQIYFWYDHSLKSLIKNHDSWCPGPASRELAHRQPVQSRLYSSSSLHYEGYTVIKGFLQTGVHSSPWPQSASELHRRSDSRLSEKLVPTFPNRRCRVVSATDPYGRIRGFLDLSRYFFFQVPLQLYSRG